MRRFAGSGSRLDATIAIFSTAQADAGRRGDVEILQETTAAGGHSSGRDTTRALASLPASSQTHRVSPVIESENNLMNHIELNIL